MSKRKLGTVKRCCTSMIRTKENTSSMTMTKQCFHRQQHNIEHTIRYSAAKASPSGACIDHAHVYTLLGKYTLRV